MPAVKRNGRDRQPNSSARYRAALITGATSGIGAAFARALPNVTRLIVTGRDAARLARLAAELAAPHRPIDAVAADLATPQGCADVIAAADRAEIDLLICCAGVGSARRFVNSAVETERQILSVNVVALVELLHALLPPMIERAGSSGHRAGVIIVSSTAAFGAGTSAPGYAASKAFGLRLARGLETELRREPVDMLALCPTFTDTEFFARAGMPPPSRTMAPETVAQEALAALGRRTVHICGFRARPQGWRLFFAANPSLVFWRWPRQIAGRLAGH